jgi:hypothetical protein
VLVWPAEQGAGARVARWRLHGDSVTAIAGLRGATPSAQGLCAMVASGGYGGLMCVWEVCGGERRPEARTALSLLADEAAAVAGRALMCVETGSDILAMCPLPQVRPSARPADAGHAHALAHTHAHGHGHGHAPARSLEPVEVCVATGHADGRVRVWDLEARRLLATVALDESAARLANPEAAPRAKVRYRSPRLLTLQYISLSYHTL